MIEAPAKLAASARSSSETGAESSLTTSAPFAVRFADNRLYTIDDFPFPQIRRYAISVAR